MKNKKIIAMGLIYFFIFTLMPMGFLVEKVQALENFKRYDSKFTEIENKYDIKGKVLKVKQYKDDTLILTKNCLYFIQSGKVRKYDLGKIDIFPKTNIEKRGKYIYLNPYRENSLYKLLTIDSEKLSKDAKFIDEYINLDNHMKNPTLLEVALDDKDNRWFTVYEKDSKLYKLLKSENNSNNKVKTIGIYEVNKDFHYDDMLTNLKIDSNENAWFKITQEDKRGKKYMLGRVSKDGKKDTFEFNDVIREYAIDSDSSIWAINKDKLLHVSKNGSLLKEIKGDNFKDITKDSNGYIWVLENNKIKKLDYGELKQVYTVLNDGKEISVQDKENIAVRNTTGFTLINRGQMENISVDSYVSNSSLVLKDDNSDVRILSDRYNNYSSIKQNDETLVDVSLKNDKLSIVNRAEAEYSNYYGSVVYNGDVYLPSEDTIYRLKNNSLEEYIKLKLNKDNFDNLNSMNVDKNGVLYAVSEKMLFIIDKNKNVKEIELSKLYSYEHIYRNNLVKDYKGDVYLITKAFEGLKVIKLDGKEYRAINYRNKYGLEPVNIFLNEKDEFEFVYKDDEKSYKVYKLDENLLPQEDVRFSNEGPSLMQTYPEIESLKKTADGKLILWIGQNMLYIKENDNSNFRGLYDIGTYDFINSMVQGNDGKVYIGTSDSGVLCYGEKINIEPSNYNVKTPKHGDDTVENKEWIIKFNAKIDKATVNEENVIVVNKTGEKQSVKVYLNDDNFSIKVIPDKSYKKGETYYIIVKKGLKSQDGKSLKKEVLAKFLVTRKGETEKENNKDVKFQIIEPKNIQLREKSFIQFIVQDWKNSYEAEAKEKGIPCSVGKVIVEDINLSNTTAYTLFNAEIVDEKGKDVKKISLKCKKVDGVWKITQ